MPKLGGLRPPAPMHSHFLPSGEKRNTEAARSFNTGELFSVMCLRPPVPPPSPVTR